MALSGLRSQVWFSSGTGMFRIWVYSYLDLCVWMWHSIPDTRHVLFFYLRNIIYLCIFVLLYSFYIIQPYALVPIECKQFLWCYLLISHIIMKNDKWLYWVQPECQSRSTQAIPLKKMFSFLLEKFLPKLLAIDRIHAFLIPPKFRPRQIHFNASQTVDFFKQTIFTKFPVDLNSVATVS